METPKNPIHEKIETIVSNLLIAIPMVICINLFFTVLIQWTPLLYLDYLDVNFNYINGYFILNNIQIGMHIIPNIFFVIILWYLLVLNIYRREESLWSMIFPKQINKFLQRVAHLFF